MARISDDHLMRYRNDGYVLVEDFMTEEELVAVTSDLSQYFPTWEELANCPEKWPELDRTGDGVAELPFKGASLNDMSTHPALVDITRRMLGEDQVFLTQSICWAKYAGRTDFEQSLHLDWHDNSLVMPRSDGAFGQLHMILYYSDITEGLAPTTVVPRSAAAGRGAVPWARTKRIDPELYDHELPIYAKTGSLLIFSAHTFHRCSGFSVEEGARVSHHLAWRGIGHEWMSWRGWAQYADHLQMLRWIQRATVEQRSVLGFPPPGHPYWNEESLELVAQRYPHMDLGPYRQAFTGTYS
ncbi:phytanoyl-CoA dioxygenase family protein [Sphaerisporangium fuscum]|uniref:phytanoyl-CoA dioxygenase family protein n=1 Tax=Sphaerisporangium fuscum TaxID=2835868 RepID=UPI001BDD955E|nr:phytanoyl-CoA dioxygenase family protein [Sphaerisporangium fuscum]